MNKTLKEKEIIIKEYPHYCFSVGDVKEAIKKLKKKTKYYSKNSLYNLKYSGEKKELMKKWNNCVKQQEEMFIEIIDEIFGVWE